MVRLNRNVLTEKQFELLFDQLEKVIDPKHTTGAGSIIRELLGDEERIMITKRLAIIILLTEDYSLYRISRVLKVSPTTVSIIKTNLDTEVYTTILRKLKKTDRTYRAILDTIEIILHGGGIMPRRYGLDRYRGT